MGRVEEAKRAAFARPKLIMKNCVIGFSGQIGSGKSTLARAVAEEFHWPCVGFGSCIREIALYRGLELSRGVLQTLGAELVESDPAKLCESVIAASGQKPGQPLVIEGIRHVEIFRIIKEMVFPLEFHLIFVTVEETLRSKRLLQRDRSHLQGRSGQHSTEKDVKNGLEDLASCVIENDQTVGIATQLIIDELRLRQSNP